LENVFEEKLKRELEDMKKKYSVDLENLKKLYTDIGDKRSEYLIQEKEDLYLKVKKLEQTVKDKEENYDFLNNEYRNLQKRTDEELSMLKIQLTIKLEELERVTNLYQEHLQIIKTLTLEKEAFKDKLDLMRNELIKKESSFKEENSELKAQLSIIKEKIANYEQIENELDKAIVSNLDDQDVLPIIKDIPTASKRRISQCLILANKLKLCSVEIEKLKVIGNMFT
jgi:chromosome segregation ATPase